MPALSWLLLIHQLPARPDYLRVKVGRRLQRIGAIAIKNSVYVMPSAGQPLEDLQWTIGEIRGDGGEANLCEARFVDGLTDAELRRRFNEARDADYAPLLDEARALVRASGRAPAVKKKGMIGEVARLRREAATIQGIDFFGAPNGEALAAALDAVTAALEPPPLRPPGKRPEIRGRVWVTRAGVQIDRMASAWLIRRFIDPRARFRFVAADRKFKPGAREIRFDMFEAEFTHQGDRCTFEALAGRFEIDDKAVRAIGEVVHDIDLKDQKYKRAETAGVAMLVRGITLAHAEDQERVRRAESVFEELYAVYHRG